MAIKSQLRLGQVTGSMGGVKTAASTKTDPTLAAAAVGSNVKDILGYLAASLQRIHGAAAGEFVNNEGGTLLSAGDYKVQAQTLLKLDSVAGDISFEDNGTAQLAFDLDGDQDGPVIQLKVDADDLLFKQFDGTEVFRVTDEAALLMAGGKKIEFGGTGAYIHNTDVGDVALVGVDIVLDASGPSSFDSDSTLTFGGSVVNITSDNGAVDIGAGGGKLLLDGANGIDIGVTADVAIDINSSTLDIDASGAITIDGATTVLVQGNTSATFGDDTEALVYDGSGNLDLDAVALDIDASGAITIDGTGTISIDAADDLNLTVTSGNAGEDLTISQVGGNDSSIFITAAGTGTDAIDIDATAGDMLIAKGLATAKTLKIGPTGAVQMVFSPHDTPASEKISLINTAGTADDAILIDAESGGLLLAAGNDSLHIDADGTDSDALNIDSAGGMDVDVAGVLDINAGDDSVIAVTTSGKDLTVGVSGGGAQVLKLDSAGSGADAIDINATAGGIDVDSAAAIDILAATTMTIKGAGVSKYGDDTATWDFDGSGAVTETGMTSLSATPSGVITLTAGAASTWSTSAGALTLRGASGAALLATDSSVDVSGSLVKFAAADARVMNGMSIDLATGTEFTTFISKPLFSNTTSIIGALNSLAGAASGGVVGKCVLTGANVTKLQLHGPGMSNASGFTQSISTLEVTPANTEVYVNGQYMVSGTSAAGTDGDYGIDRLAAGAAAINFQFSLKPDDVIVVKTSAQQ